MDITCPWDTVYYMFRTWDVSLGKHGSAMQAMPATCRRALFWIAQVSAGGLLSHARSQYSSYRPAGCLALWAALQRFVEPPSSSHQAPWELVVTWVIWDSWLMKLERFLPHFIFVATLKQSQWHILFSLIVARIQFEFQQVRSGEIGIL